MPATPFSVLYNPLMKYLFVKHKYLIVLPLYSATIDTGWYDGAKRYQSTPSFGIVCITYHDDVLGHSLIALNKTCSVVSVLEYIVTC